MHCRRCNYDLRYTRDPRCPECGTAFDPNPPAPRPRRSPEEMRELLGRAFAIAATVAFLTFALSYLVAYQSVLAERADMVWMDNSFHTLTPKSEAFVHALGVAIAIAAPVFLVTMMVLNRCMPRENKNDNSSEIAGRKR